MKTLIILSLMLGCGSLAYAASNPESNPGVNLEDRFLSDVQCAAQVQEQFKSLQVTREWSLSTLREMDGSRRLLSPTAIVGVWVEAQIFLNKEVLVRRITEHFIETRRFNLVTCEIEKKLQRQNSQLASQQQQASRYFSDRDLRALVKSHTKGVIYVWSPNMPYSYAPVLGDTNGIGHLRAAATRLGAHVTVLLDPEANRDYALEIIRKQTGMTEEDARSVQSIELVLRAMGNHYPVILVYANGKLARHIYPGVGTEAEYFNYMQGQFNDLQN